MVSHGANARGCANPLLTHAECLAPGPDPAARTSAHQALFADALSDDLVEDIRSYLQQQKALGANQFRSWVEARTGRFAAVRPVGRPPAFKLSLTPDTRPLF